MSNTQDKILIRRLRAKNRKAFEEVYLAYYAKLIGFSRKFNFRLLTPEDFVHETFLQLFNKANLLKDDVLLDKQIYVICRNIILNQIKREKKFELSDGHNESLLWVQEDYLFGEMIDDRESLLHSIIKELPEKRKEVFILHKLEQLSYKEIIEKTGLSKKTIANHIYLASKYISDEMKKNVSID